VCNIGVFIRRRSPTFPLVTNLGTQLIIVLETVCTHRYAGSVYFRPCWEMEMSDQVHDPGDCASWSTPTLAGCKPQNRFGRHDEQNPWRFESRFSNPCNAIRRCAFILDLQATCRVPVRTVT